MFVLNRKVSASDYGISLVTNYVFRIQPFFIFKHIAFKLRQIFKLNTTVVRSKVIYLPVFIPADKQVAYGVSHLIYCALQLKKEERVTTAYALYVVLLNCFFKI